MKNLIIISLLSFLSWNVGAQAMADFTYSQNDPFITTIQFTNTSQNAIEYSWDFGDGTILPFFVNAVNPSHTYSSAGTYQVCLTAKPFLGANDQTCYFVTVTCPQPTAGLFASQLDNCTPEVQFTNQSEDYTSLLWDFGDGNISTDENPTHMYSSDGTYTVSVTATNSCGSNTYLGSLDVIDYDAPIANPLGNGFDISYPNYSTVQFDEDINNNHILGFTMVWDFGDGTGSSVKNPFHLYQNTGVYTVCATATNQCGTSPTYCDDVTIGCVPPIADFIYNQSSSSLPIVDFTSTSTANDIIGSPSYSWDFGDGYTSSDSNPTHTYLSDGIYTVSLTITNTCAWDMYTTTIEVASGSYVDASATGTNDGSSWANAFTDLQSALTLGTDNQIFVAEGTYYPTSGTSRSVFFDIPTGTTLMGGYPMGGGTRDVDLHPTILSGDVNMDGLPQGNSFHVVRLQEVNSVTLDGITITGGNADNANSFARARGGGIYSVSANNVLINNCILEGNEAVFGGGIFATLSPNFTIEESIVQSNTANNGSGLYHSNETTMYIYKSRIIDNNSLIRCAIEINNSSHTHIENSVIANNASLNANAIGFIATNRDQTCEIYNSTILGETKNKYLITLQVGFNDVLDVEMYNTIVSHQNTNFNKTFKDYNNGTLNLATHYCYIQGSSVIGTTQSNLYSNTDGDLILNPDYSLSACSPGNNDGWSYVVVALSSTTDIIGNPREEGTIDIGAYESTSFCFNRMTTEAIKEPTINWEVYPNPVSDILNIKVPEMETTYQLSVVNSLGQIIRMKEIQAGQNRVELQVSDLPMGNYWIQLKNADEQYQQQIHIAR